MGLYNKLPEDVKEVDIIIAGGGTAGCIVAGRLTEADPGLSILVIEGGQENYDNPKVVTPALYPLNFQPDSETAIFYKSAKSKYIANREYVVPSGGTLGGGSSMNFLMYTRAQREDYDSWNTPGWTTDELWPYLKKIETYHGPGNPEHHGFNGPIHVSDGPFRGKTIEDDWLRASTQVGYPEIKDLQSLDTNNGFQRWLKYATPEGKRSDVARGYIHPRLRDGKHPNLHVLVENNVVRVLLDENKRAYGVEFTPNTRFQAQVNGSGPYPKQVVRARKLVIVSCGACGTPPVLERSGIGSRDILNRAGVSIIQELPGVGSSYQDHLKVPSAYKTNLSQDETADALISGRLTFEDALAQEHPHLGWNYVDLSSKIRPTDAEAVALGPEFQASWERDFKYRPNKPLIAMVVVSGLYGDNASVLPTGQYVSILPFTTYSYSRGHMHITGPEVSDTLDFDTGFFNDENDIDLKKLIWAYKKGREIMRRTSMFAGEHPPCHPRFPKGSKAAVIEEWDQSIRGKPPVDLEYSAEDDAALEQYIREHVETSWHSLGTAKMAPREEMGVVDKSLNVYGVQGLKVVDMSIPPKNVNANTANTAMVIGERAADIIAKELGIVLK
ncbi:putative alcohol oxidase [Daldinia sp. FL1419]|nr:putative alcohol oxidase [Daldinia sp. FL1419]